LRSPKRATSMIASPGRRRDEAQQQRLPDRNHRLPAPRRVRQIPEMFREDNRFLRRSPVPAARSIDVLRLSDQRTRHIRHFTRSTRTSRPISRKYFF
jgi:hypothetical protein